MRHIDGTVVGLLLLAAMPLAACGASDGTQSPQLSPSGASGISGSIAGSGSASALNTGGHGAPGGAGASTGAVNQGSGGTRAGSGGVVANTSSGGALASAGHSGMSAPGSGGSSAPITPVTPGTWAAADPTKKGPYMTVTESNTGPDGMFTMYRPMDLSDQPHPVVTWGNGTGTTPPVYAFLLNQLASHGFIVIASNSMNVGQGTPPPMIAGIDWVIKENDDAMSPLYHHVDTAHIGATGHSQGAFAATTAGSDARITAIAPIEGTLPGQLHGPALLLCGGMDTTVGCMGAMSAFSSDTVPVMYAELAAATHTNWIGGGFGGGPLHPFVVTVTAWMRVHLMGDTSLKSMFYGPDCSLCKDTAWKIMQKMLN